MIWKMFGRNRTRLIVLAAVSLLTVLGTLMMAPAAHAYDDQELAFLTLINNYRAQNGLPPLAMSNALYNAAEGHSYDMATRDYFSHTGSDGSTPWDRIRGAGYTYNTYLAENIVAGYGVDSAQAAFNVWRNSPPHNANMLSPYMHAIGVGRYYQPGSQYGWYWTTDFGGVQDDTTPPSVALPYPTGSSLVSGTVNVQAIAWDNVAVTQVNLYVDGNLVATPTSPPYSFTLDTSTLAPGPHTLSAIAHDTAGMAAQADTTVTVDNFTPSYRYLFTWYDQLTPGLQDWVLMANPPVGTASARSSVLVGPYTYADRNTGAGAPPETPAFPGVMGGPVSIFTTQPLITSQRVIYNDSFNEIAGLRSDQLNSTYYFTWYDSSPGNGMKGDWILIGNQGSTNANVQVYIAGRLMNTYTIAPGGRVTPSYPNTTGGPVKVTCTNGQPLIVSQRVIYQNAFNEVWGVPQSKLTSDYHFPWYDFTDQSQINGDWILVENQDTGDASVDIYIAGQKRGTYTVQPGTPLIQLYKGVMGGPVEVVSTNGKKLLVSQRILYKGSFEEVQGLTGSDAGTDQWFTWYDSMPSHGMNGNWILVTNMGQSDAAVNIYVNGNLMSSVTVPAGGNLPVSYYNMMGGPVRVLSMNGQPLLVTQRVIYKNSFNEVAGMKY